jgi:hypothetical protein
MRMPVIASRIIPAPLRVIPAKAGIQAASAHRQLSLDSRFRGNDGAG